MNATDIPIEEKIEAIVNPLKYEIEFKKYE